MVQDYIPQRGVDFDDFVGTSYFEKSLKMQNPQMVPVYCPANDKHDDDFIGIRLSGYAMSDGGLKLVQRIIYPAKNRTDADVKRLFDATTLEDGTVKYTPKSSVSFDELYVRVCYKTQGQPNPEVDNIKWVAGVDGGEMITLTGDRRVYQPKDAEE